MIYYYAGYIAKTEKKSGRELAATSCYSEPRWPYNPPEPCLDVGYIQRQRGMKHRAGDAKSTQIPRINMSPVSYRLSRSKNGTCDHMSRI